MKRTLIIPILLLFQIIHLNSQTSYRYYFDDLDNHFAGNPNVVYDDVDDNYYFVEWQRDLSVSQMGGFQVKKVDENGHLLDSGFFPSDSNPYSAHYISDIEMQGDDIVVFFNRNINESSQYGDVFIVRINKDLEGAYTSKRYFLTGNNSLSSIRISDVVKVGGKLYFTGSLFLPWSDTSYDLDARLLVGMLDENGMMTHKIFDVLAGKTEGLNIKYKGEDTFLISGRYLNKSEGTVPLLVRLSLDENDGYAIDWAKTYDGIRVDKISWATRVKGVGIPILDAFSTYDYPAFLSRDNEEQNLVLTFFDPNNGDPMYGAGLKFPIPYDVHLIDGMKMGEKNSDAFMALLVREENSSHTNTESYIFKKEELATLFSDWYDLTSAGGIHSALARKFIDGTNRKVAIGLSANVPDYPYASHMKSTLLIGDDYDFNCLEHQVLRNYTQTEMKSENLSFFSVKCPLQEEMRTMDIPLDYPLIQKSGCIKNAQIMEQRRLDGNDIGVYPNPAQHQLNITLGNREEVHLEIYDISGKLLQGVSMTSSNNILDTHSYPNGFYMLMISDKNGHLLKKEKLLVQH